ncbi:MAG: T9SS type A sorting domain-containing protein [Ignavibacteriaceae bacterium]|nr:T9SS type A sorting domain-containing protein [Ignavibacteriaceae bacterium]
MGPTYQPSIGSYNRTGGSYFWGYIDDIRIYDRALTVDEIDSLFNEGTTSVENIDATIPNEIELQQNYPNPFNPSTTINFSIPEASFVSLKVFNSLGQEIETLIAKELSAGNFKYSWDAKNFTSGIYFYRLQAGDFIQTKKMILMK